MARIIPRAGMVVALLLGTLAAPAQAKHYQHLMQVKVYAPPRVYDHVVTLAIEDFERTRPPSRFRSGGHTHPVFWSNALIGGYPVPQALRAMRRGGQSPSAVFADRPLKAKERRRFKVVTPLFDDADVMVLAAGHPACQGMTRAQARGIVAGRITRWSQIVAGASSDAISVRYRRSGGAADLRFGARYVRRGNGRFRTSYPSGSRGSADGGIGAAASGDQSVAAVTSWSRFSPRPGVCAVPLGGVAPADATVSDHSYPEAFRVDYVVPKRRIRFGPNRMGDKVLQDFMRSDAAKEALARRGVLVVGGAPPAGPGDPGEPSVAAPATDHAGRPISTTPDPTAEQALVGLRLDSPVTAEGFHRLVLDPDGVLRRLTFDAAGTCVREVQGGWFVKGGWRYPEHGGGLIARLGWFLDDPVEERVVDLPAAEPGTVYVVGAPYARAPATAGTCGVG